MVTELTVLKETAESTEDAEAIVRRAEPSAAYIEARESDDLCGFEVFVYTSHARHGTEPVDSPGAHAHKGYRINYPSGL